MAIKWPLTGSISSPFGDTRNRPSPHSGTDIRGRNGDPIRAGATGRVHHTGYNTPASGNVVTIIYPVKGGNLYALYSHVEPRYPVRVGQTVTEGQVIAYSGTSGNTGGGHVHIECYLNGRLVNPEHYFAGTVPAGGGSTPITGMETEMRLIYTGSGASQKRALIGLATGPLALGTPVYQTFKNAGLPFDSVSSGDYNQIIRTLTDNAVKPSSGGGLSSAQLAKVTADVTAALKGSVPTAAQIAKAVNEDAAKRLAK